MSLKGASVFVWDHLFVAAFGFFQTNELFFHSSYHYNGIFGVRCQWYFYFHFFHISGDDFLYGNGTSVESRLQFTTRCQMKRIHRDGFFILVFLFFSFLFECTTLWRFELKCLHCVPDKYYSTKTNILFSMDFVLFAKLVAFLQFGFAADCLLFCSNSFSFRRHRLSFGLAALFCRNVFSYCPSFQW